MSEARAANSRPGGDVPVRDAATVVLLRDGATELEVWLLTRVRQMTFAAGMSVFPGGRVDDDDAALPLVGADVAALAARFECSEHTAHALLAAAVRETFEETGVLLTRPIADLRTERADVESGRRSFGELLQANGLVADASGLRPWARWVTPAGEVRRYDTRFFVAALPDGAEAADVTTESSAAEWLPIGTAIEQAQRGERMLLPPTLSTLASLQAFPTVVEALAGAEGRTLAPVAPKLRLDADGGPSVELPDGQLVVIPRSMLP